MKTFTTAQIVKLYNSNHDLMMEASITRDVYAEIFGENNAVLDSLDEILRDIACFSLAVESSFKVPEGDDE